MRACHPGVREGRWEEGRRGGKCGHCVWCEWCPLVMSPLFHRCSYRTILPTVEYLFFSMWRVSSRSALPQSATTILSQVVYICGMWQSCHSNSSSSLSIVFLLQSVKENRPLPSSPDAWASYKETNSKRTVIKSLITDFEKRPSQESKPKAS